MKEVFQWPPKSPKQGTSAHISSQPILLFIDLGKPLSYSLLPRRRAGDEALQLSPFKRLNHLASNTDIFRMIG